MAMDESESTAPMERTVSLSLQNVRATSMLVDHTATDSHPNKASEKLAFNGLLSNKLLTGLPGQDFARLLPLLEPISLLRGQEIYSAGESSGFAYFPESAVISHIYLLEDGSTSGIDIIGNEGMVGLSAILGSRPPSCWAQVTVSGNAMRIEVDVLRREFARGQGMQQTLLGYTRTRLAHLTQQTVCNGRHSLDERLCTWLLLVQYRAREDRLPLTHEEIALHLGARRAGVSIACNSLRDAGVINYRRGLIHIVDRRGLEAVACECYATLIDNAQLPSQATAQPLSRVSSPR